MKFFVLVVFAIFSVLTVNSMPVDEDTAVLMKQSLFGVPNNGVFGLLGMSMAEKNQKEACLRNVRNVRLTRLRNGRVYLFNPLDKVPWQQARQKCASLGMYLATASTQEESNLLIEHVKQMPSVIGAVSSAPTIDSFLWTGLNALQNTAGGWYWDSTGQATTFTQWATAQPVADLFCGGINKDVPAIPEVSISGWAAQDCADPRGYICELPRSCSKYVNAIYSNNDVY